MTIGEDIIQSLNDALEKVNTNASRRREPKRDKLSRFENSF